MSETSPVDPEGDASSKLSPDVVRYFRDSLREARALALRDAEGFAEVIFAIERLGRYLHPHGRGLGNYFEKICALAERSALAQAIETAPGRLQTPFGPLYRLVRNARNAALHEGAYARLLTSRCVELALVIEDALMEDMEKIGDFMVRGPVCASPWQPLSFIRQAMLANSFSFLPVWITHRGGERWYLVSDHALAGYLRGSAGSDERLTRLRESLETAIESGQLSLVEPFVCKADCAISEALARCRGLPILVHGVRDDDLVGIASPFDLL